MKTLKFNLVVALIGILACSCSDDDGYSSGDVWVATGTVIKTTDYFYIVIDDGNVLYPMVKNISADKLDDGMRTYISYTILESATDNKEYDYYIKINNMSEILTKPLFNFDETTPTEVRDSIGSDAITIKDTWFTNDYLNVYFEYGTGLSYVHYINLVKDTKNLKTEDGEIILELKHNKNNDPHSYLQWGIASFDISELKVKGQKSVNIFIRSIDKEGNYQYNKALTYKYDETNLEARARTFSSIEITEMIE